MNLSGFSIRRPVTTTLLMLSILLFGVISYRSLPVSDLPNVDYPTIQVSANVPGANPETMASAVATVLERQFSTIAGIDSMSSVNVQGQTTITITFNLSRDIDAAAQDVQSAIGRAAKYLPQDMPAPPSYQKVNPADQPILYIAITSPTLPLSALDEFGQTIVAQRVSMINGVAQVQVYGSQKYAVRIQLDPGKLFAREISLGEVVDAVKQANVNLPTGILFGPEMTFTIKADGQLMTAEKYLDLIVAYRNGKPVRLKDVGTALDSVENDKLAAWYNTADTKQRALFLAVQRQPGMNTVQVAQDVKKVLPMLKAQLPQAASLEVIYDRSMPINKSADDAQFTLLLTLVLVVMVIFIFLRNISATVIPALALPMSLIGTFIVMHLLGYSLNNLSLMALTLSIGFVVDDAIVMLENIVRHSEMKKSAMQAALDGSGEIGFTIVSMTLSLAAVFIPVLFLGDITGRLFREFAVTIGVAVLISGFVSLTLTPVMCSRLLRPSSQVNHGRLYMLSENWFNSVLGFYDRTLRWALQHRLKMMILSAAMLVLTIVLFKVIPKGFIPNEDQDMIRVATEAREGISHKAMFELQQKLAEIVRNDPNVEAFMSSAGSGRMGSSQNSGAMFIRLKPSSQRKLSADEIVQQLRAKLSTVPGISAFPQVPPLIQIGGRMTKSQFQYTLQGPDIEQTYQCANQLLEEMRKIQGLVDVTSDIQLSNPELHVQIDRDKASSLGISASNIEMTLLHAYGASQISTIYTPNNQYQVLVELLPEFQTSPAVLSLLYARSDTGRLVPINAVAKLKQDVGPLSVNHSGQLPSVTLSFNITKDIAIGDAITKIGEAADKIVPNTIAKNFQGTAQTFQSSLKSMGILLILAIIVIYIVLGMLYENFYHPITILSALPFAGAGALLALLVFKEDLSLYAFVGIIMLVGLVKKNGIIMIDFAIEAQRKEKLTAAEAIHKACLIRFRPIMMTTFAALMAGLPIALGMGAGGDARRSLGIAVVGGLIVSQTLTLYVTPVFYLYMERLQDFVARWRNSKAKDFE